MFRIVPRSISCGVLAARAPHFRPNAHVAALSRAVFASARSFATDQKAPLEEKLLEKRELQKKADDDFDTLMLLHPWFNWLPCNFWFWQKDAGGVHRPVRRSPPPEVHSDCDDDGGCN